MLVKPPKGHPLNSPRKAGLRHLRATALRQGRYKSLIVEEESYLGALLHYVHLNPVRAGMCDVAGLSNYRWSSYWFLRNPAARPNFLDPTGALWAAGNLADNPRGYRSYEQFLQWLSEDAGARKEMAFDQMCRGWALGSKEFKRELLQSEGPLKEGSFDRLRMEGKDLKEANELIWDSCLRRSILAAGKTDADLQGDKKSAPWKIWIASELKRHTSALSTWIAGKLTYGGTSTSRRLC